MSGCLDHPSYDLESSTSVPFNSKLQTLKELVTVTAVLRRPPMVR